MPVPAAVPLLETTASPPVKPNDTAVLEVGGADTLPRVKENAAVGPPASEKYTYCPFGPFHNPGVLKVDPTLPGGSSWTILSTSVRFMSVPPQTRLGSTVYPPMLVVLTT